MKPPTSSFTELLTWSKAIKLCEAVGCTSYDFRLLAAAMKPHPVTRQPMPVLERVRVGKAKGRRRRARYRRDQILELLQVSAA